MDFVKFVVLLEKRALFFVRADKLNDPFEGSYSRVNVALRPHLYRDSVDPAALAGLPYALRDLRRFHLLSCWHENSYESAAMWQLYSGEQKGIAIRTSFGSLSANLTGDEPIYIGRVKYVDYETTFIPEANLFSSYLHKRKSFEHEREVRAVYLANPASDSNQPMALCPDVCDIGLNLPINLSQLVEEVVVAPFAEQWFLELTQAVAAKFGLSAPVRRSSLAESPVW